MKKLTTQKHFQKFPVTGVKLLFTLLCVMGILNVFPASAKVFSQYQKINISVSDVSVEELIKVIKSQASIDFLYNIQEIETKGTVSVKMMEATVAEVLTEAFKEKNLSFSIEKGVVVIKPVLKRVDQVKERVIRGIVKNENGEVLPGVTVLVQGTKTGVVTDTKGNFQLALPEEQVKNLVLQFTFVGMTPKTVVYKNELVMTVVMEEEIAALDEVVVTGYQVLDRRTQTSAISSVRAADILVPGMMSIDAALEGQIPELMVINNSGEVGSTPRLRVRGTTTLVGNREPLWVVDGFPITDPVPVDPETLNDPDYINIIGNAIGGINPQDIERIDVLKDASATALYGVKASNGVIVITTKKGQRGMPRISYSHTSKFTQRPRYSDRAINLMNSAERIQFGKDLCDLHYVFPSNMVMVGYEGAYYRYQTGQTNYNQFLNEVQQYEATNTDWFSILTRDTYSHDHNVSISGGSEDLTYYTSVGYSKDEGVSRTTYNERYTVRVNLDANITKKLKTDIGFSGNVIKKNNLHSDINAMDYAYNTTRAIPCYNPDGSLYYYQNIAYANASLASKQYNTYRYNILNEINNSSNSYDGNTLNANINLKYKPSRTIDITLQGSYGRSSTLQEQWWGEKSSYVARLKNGEYEEAPMEGIIQDDGTAKGGECELPYGGILKTQNTINDNYTLRFQANLRQSLGKNKDHYLSEMVIYEVRGTKYKSYDDENRGYMKERGLQFVEYPLQDLLKFPYYATWLGESHRTIKNTVTNNLSGTVSASYSYKNNLTLNSNIRMEASNKFGDRSRSRFLPIWSASFMFNFKETLLKQAEFLNTLSLRSSYGVQGNMLDSESPNLVIKRQAVDPFYNENTSIVARYPNPNLRWEKTQNVNVSLDISLFNSRLNLNGSYYYRKTTDNFQLVSVSSVNGVANFQMNNGTVFNKGYSVSVDITAVKTKDVSLRFTTMYSGNLNKVNTGTADSYNFDHYLNGDAIVSGEAISTFYSYNFLGLNPINGTPMFNDYEDRRHLLQNKSLEETIKMTMVKSGQRDPKFEGNLNTYLTYKKFSLSMSFTYKLGSKVRLFPLYAPVLAGIKATDNVRKEFTNRWLAPGDENYTNIPAILSPSDPDYEKYYIHYSGEDYNSTHILKFANNVWDMYDKSNIRVISGNYVKCQSFRFSYNFPTNLLRGTPIKSASISLNATNLFTISAKALKGQDPSQAGFDKPNLSVRPNYSLGINVSF